MKIIFWKSCIDFPGPIEYTESGIAQRVYTWAIFREVRYRFKYLFFTKLNALVRVYFVNENKKICRI